jgi:hypothetical protein
MMQKFKSPAVAAAVGILLSVAVGVAMAVRLLGPMMNRPDALPKNPVTPELKERGWDFWTIEIDNLSNELKEERGRLRKQADLLEQRAARLAADEKELNKDPNLEGKLVMFWLISGSGDVQTASASRRA